MTGQLWVAHQPETQVIQNHQWPGSSTFPSMRSGCTACIYVLKKNSHHCQNYLPRTLASFNHYPKMEMSSSQENAKD